MRTQEDKNRDVIVNAVLNAALALSTIGVRLYEVRVGRMPTLPANTRLPMRVAGPLNQIVVAEIEMPDHCWPE